MRRITVISIVILAAGCASLEGDDFGVIETQEPFNRWSYTVTDNVDRAVLAPVARGYTNVTPQVLETGITNMFQNLRTVASSANGFLQGKPRSGAEDLARFVINSTLGLAGFFVAKRAVGQHFEAAGTGLVDQVCAVRGEKTAVLAGIAQFSQRQS